MDLTNKEWWKVDKDVKVEYRSCTICMNEMQFIRSTNGNYWICKVCNNTSPDF